MPNWQAYVITVGTEIGVFKEWHDVLHRTSGISGAVPKGFKDWDRAQEYFDAAYARGETRVVRRAPSPGSGRRGQQQRSAGASVARSSGTRQRPTAKESPRPQEHKPLAGRGTSVKSKGGWSSVSGTAKRDAVIAIAVEEVNRKNRGSVSARQWRTEPPQRAAPVGAAPSAPRAITAPPQFRSAPSHQASANASSGIPASPQQQHALPARTSVPPKTSAREIEPPRSSSSFSTSSSPPTAVTQTRNIFSSDGGSQASRYAQSLYSSSPENWSVGLRSPPLASSDWRSQLSEPSSLGTRYYPEDWLARQRQRRSPHVTPHSPEISRSPLGRSTPVVFEGRPQSPAASDSEYTTAPNTPEAQIVELPDASTPGLRDRPSVEVMPPPPLPFPRAEGTSSTTTDFRSTVSPSASKKRQKVIGRSMSEAQVQTERQPQSQRRQQEDAAVQTDSPLRKCYTDGQVQTSPSPSPWTSPLRATVSEGDVFGHSPARRSPALSSRSSFVPQPESTTPSASPMSVSSRCPLALVTPVLSTSSSPSSERQSLGSPIGGHTPVMGHSETQVFMRPITNSIQATMDAINFMEPARGAEVIVHDTRFDPRSPIHRGTAIPAGTSGSVIRPSPAMLPLNSLLFH